MGFYVTKTECERREKTHSPLKNRVMGSRRSPPLRAGRSAPQPLEPHRENRPTPTTTASGVRYYGKRYYQPQTGRWLSRDPIGDVTVPNPLLVRGLRGRTGIRPVLPLFARTRNDYTGIGNDPVDLVDAFGLQVGAVKKTPCCQPIPTKTCDDICAMARAAPPGAIGQGGNGKVICYGHQMCPCVLNSYLHTYGLTIGECPELEKIIKEHETGHMKDESCPRCGGLYEAEDKPGVDNAQKLKTECANYRADIPKLEAYIWRTPPPPDACLGAALDFYVGKLEWLTDNCQGIE